MATFKVCRFLVDLRSLPVRLRLLSKSGSSRSNNKRHRFRFRSFSQSAPTKFRLRKSKKAVRSAPPFTLSGRTLPTYKRAKNNERPDHEGLGRPGSPPPELLAAQSKRVPLI